jgi:Phytanoyl-CoA dioxygenase (PhyH)
MPGLLRHAPDTSIAELGDALLRDGYVIVERAAPELCGQAYTELIGDIEAAPTGHLPFLGARTKRLGGLLKRSEAVRNLTVHPIVLGLADAILQPYCARYQLNFSGIMHLLPGADAQQLHRDGDLYPFRHPCPPMLMPTMWALSDFAASNGATSVVPGSHMWAENRDPFVDEIASAEMPAGSLLVYLGGTLHGGGTNSAGVTRTGLALQYSAGWLRQEENQYLVNPPEVARTFSDRLQRLVGYDFGGPYLGFVSGASPQRVLVDDHDGPRERSNPEVDALAARMHRLPWGSLKPVPTPERSGERVSVNRGPLGVNEIAEQGPHVS